MSEPQRLAVSQAPDGGLVLSGVIDETARLGDLMRAAAGNRLRLDLGGVRFINSLGVREWIRFLAGAATHNIAVDLARVSEPMIQQLNMIVAARGRARVVSFFAPYACDACGREESLVIDLEPNRAGLLAGRAPPSPCPECGAAMAFNDFPQRYFLFLTEPGS
jgi:hypothetical protein